MATLVRADWLILLTDVDGLYTANPATDPTAQPIYEVADLSQLNVCRPPLAPVYSECTFRWLLQQRLGKTAWTLIVYLRHTGCVIQDVIYRRRIQGATSTNKSRRQQEHGRSTIPLPPS